MDEIKLYEVDGNYINFLLPYAPHLFQNSKSSQKNERKYIGVVLKVNGFDYFAPLSSFKDKHKSMYIDPYKIKFTSSKVKLEKISSSLKENRQVLNWINLAEKDRIPLNVKYYNPRVIFDGYNFYLTVGLEDKDYLLKTKSLEKESNPIGIDLNINTFVSFV